MNDQNKDMQKIDLHVILDLKNKGLISAEAYDKFIQENALGSFSKGYAGELSIHFDYDVNQVKAVIFGESSLNQEEKSTQLLEESFGGDL